MRTTVNVISSASSVCIKPLPKLLVITYGACALLLFRTLAAFICRAATVGASPYKTSSSRFFLQLVRFFKEEDYLQIIFPF